LHRSSGAAEPASSHPSRMFERCRIRCSSSATAGSRSTGSHLPQRAWRRQAATGSIQRIFGCFAISPSSAVPVGDESLTPGHSAWPVCELFSHQLGWELRLTNRGAAANPGLSVERRGAARAGEVAACAGRARLRQRSPSLVNGTPDRWLGPTDPSPPKKTR
jgi:hypothetical protein